jgi:hypothetical protein
MTNEPLNIGDMVVWCTPYRPYDDNAEKYCGVIVDIQTEADGEIVYNVDWFEHNKTPYRKEFLRKVS